MPVVLRAAHTHLYPGARGSLGPGDALRWSAGARDIPCVVEFSDGSAARATLESFAGDGARLRVGGYATLAGTAIPAKRWLLELGWRESAGEGFSVKRRLPLDGDDRQGS